MTKQRKLMIIFIILSLIVVVSVGCGNKEKNANQDPSTIEDSVEDIDMTDGDKATLEDDKKQLKDGENKKTTLSLENQEGEAIEIDTYDKKLSIITFWVDWSEESKEQLRVLENIYPLLQDQVQFFGVHATGFDTITKEEAKDKISILEYAYPILIDEKSEAQETYFVGNFPTTVIIDEDGNLLLSLTSLIREDELLDEIEAILEDLLY